MTDVPLPEPFLEDVDYELWGQNAKADCYSAEQLRSYAEACVKAERERAQAEVMAWRERFPAYVYRPQDDCVSLRLDQAMDGK